jgi:8-oxo-dGTP diphosphatase
MTIGHFLAGIGALMWDPQNDEYFLVRRVAHKDYAAGAWECITGRVDQGESFEQALHREVFEEAGAKVQIEFIIATTHFFRGEETPQNELLGLIYGCTVLNREDIFIGEEHSEGGWFSVEQALATLPEDYWLRNVIQRAELLKAQLSADLRKIYQNEGFNIG